jgi:hypothetical protein
MDNNEDCLAAGLSLVIISLSEKEHCLAAILPVAIISLSENWHCLAAVLQINKYELPQYNTTRTTVRQ